MSGPEKKRKRIYDLLNQAKISLTTSKAKILQKKEHFKAKKEWRIEPKTNRMLF